MNAWFIASVGELIIVELSVLFIWFRVLNDAVKRPENTLAHKRLLLTSVGLVLNALAILILMSFRLYEYTIGFWPFVPGIVVCYVILAIGNLMFIITASLGTKAGFLKLTVVLTVFWTLVCLFGIYNEWIPHNA